MRRDPVPRSRRPDLLTRPPSRADGHGSGWAALFDPSAALVELADLFARGLISLGELERQITKVLATVTSGSSLAGVPRPCAEPPPPPRRADAQLAVDRLEVELEGVGGHVELGGDLAHGEPAGQQAQHIALPARQGGGGIAGRHVQVTHRDRRPAQAVHPLLRCPVRDTLD